jgi:two-component system sensor histidine kinase KdpD
VPHGDRRGAGLGLSICKAIVEAHGGKIQAGRNQPTGARFWFELPLLEPPSIEGRGARVERD